MLRHLSFSAPQMEVGIEDCLHIEFEYSKGRYQLADTVVGKIYFLLVRIRLKHMEIEIRRRETTGARARPLQFYLKCRTQMPGRLDVVPAALEHLRRAVASLDNTTFSCACMQAAAPRRTTRRRRWPNLRSWTARPCAARTSPLGVFRAPDSAHQQWAPTGLCFGLQTSLLLNLGRIGSDWTAGRMPALLQLTRHPPGNAACTRSASASWHQVALVLDL